MIVGFINLTKSLVHASMDFCTWSDKFLDLNICLFESNSYYSNLRLKEKVFDIDSRVPIFNFNNFNEFSKLLLKVDKEIIVCNISLDSIDDDDSYFIFEKLNIVFLIIENECW